MLLKQGQGIVQPLGMVNLEARAVHVVERFPQQARITGVVFN
jgi:hypothetical protein